MIPTFLQRKHVEFDVGLCLGLSRCGTLGTGGGGRGPWPPLFHQDENLEEPPGAAATVTSWHVGLNSLGLQLGL